MRGFVITLVCAILLIALFVVGALNASSGLMVAGFCAGPLVTFMLGWTAHTALRGRKLVLAPVEADEPVRRIAAPPPPQRDSRLEAARRRAAASGTTEHSL